MWTAEIVSAAREGCRGQIKVELSQAGETVARTYTLDFARDLDWLKRQVAAEVVKLDGLDELLGELVVGPFDYTLPEDPPTQEELDEAEFWRKWKVLGRVKTAIEEGLLTEEDVDVVALRARLVELFKKAYLGL